MPFKRKAENPGIVFEKALQFYRSRPPAKNTAMAKTTVRDTTILSTDFRPFVRVALSQTRA